MIKNIFVKFFYMRYTKITVTIETCFLMKFNVLDNGSSDFLLFLSREKTFLNEINGDADDNNDYFAG